MRDTGGVRSRGSQDIPTSHKVLRFFSKDFALLVEQHQMLKSGLFSHRVEESLPSCLMVMESPGGDGCKGGTCPSEILLGLVVVGKD